MIKLAPDILIDEREIGFEASRSSGPGGQNVNKLNTRMTAVLNINTCSGLTDEQRNRIRSKIVSRISAEGLLRVSSQEYRSQAANRQAAQERLLELLRTSLSPVRRRKPTRMPRAARIRRLEQKNRCSTLKKLRKPPGID